MNVISYAVRPSIATAETTYELGVDDLVWTGAQDQQRIHLAEVETVRLFTSPAMRYRGMGDASFGGFDMLVVRTRDGRNVKITSKHYQQLAVFEDRSATFGPFVEAVIARVADINPAAHFVWGMPSSVRWLWIGVAAVLALAAIFGVLMVIESATGRGSIVGLLGGLVFTLGTGLSLRSVLREIAKARQRVFDPRKGMPTA